MTPVFVNQTRTRIPKAYLTRWVRLLARELSRRKIGQDLSRYGLTLAFVAKSQMRSLNHQYRGKDSPTDVLSFAPVDAKTELGELVFCPSVIQKQAKVHGYSFRDELCYLVLHGILHLLGFEHEQGGPQAEAMLTLQDEVFARVLPKMDRS